MLSKYLSVESTRLVLEKGNLRWSRPSLFNDPFDVKPYCRFAPDFAEIKQEFRDSFRAVINNEVSGLSVNNSMAQLISNMRIGYENGFGSFDTYEQHVLQFVEELYADSEKFCRRYYHEVVNECAEIKVLCLSENHNQTLMWSHYAASHRGAILLFEPADKESIFSVAQPVRYRSEAPYIFDSGRFCKVFTGQMSMTDSDFLREIFDEITLTKGTAWAYEEEWRIVLGIGHDHQAEVEYTPFDPRDLVGIIFGCKADNNFIAEVSKIVSSKYGTKRLMQGNVVPDSGEIEVRDL